MTSPFISRVHCEKEGRKERREEELGCRAPLVETQSWDTPHTLISVLINRSTLSSRRCPETQHCVQTSAPAELDHRVSCSSSSAAHSLDRKTLRAPLIV
ncbi:hypothetical protein E2C01_042087 [Portunus trituberculatus]|uniref:Uncharacterized protein n=1 Tax=Portunus trituberculatus TaxID=210409 RepID=A0A5B7FTM0_PORTR|nr:hypothetical protein [Portunus trituberculatus]